MSGLPDSGTALMPSTILWLPSARRMWQVVPPISPTIIGSTTVSANWVATAASTALPPPASISMPAAEASGWFDATMPRLPCAGFFSQVKRVPARSRQFDAVMMYAPVIDVSGNLACAPLFGEETPASAEGELAEQRAQVGCMLDRKSTRLNSSHTV